MAGHARPVMDGRELEVNGVYDDVVAKFYDNFLNRAMGMGKVRVMSKDIFDLDKINY